MAIQLSVLCRNARLDAIEVYGSTSCSMEIRTLGPPADCSSAGVGSVLATILLPADWMLAASAGAKAKTGTWQDVTADASGTAGHFRIYNSQATKDGTTCFIQGTCQVGGGDLSLDANPTINQIVTVTGFTLTDGNA